MAKVKVFIDLDDTLIRTSQLKLEMLGIISGMGVPEDVVRQGYEDSKDGNGIPIIEKLVNSFAEYGVDAQELRGRLETMYSTIGDENLFMDRLVYIKKKFPCEDHDYILITKGEPYIQKWKIKGSGLGASFDEVTVVSTIKARALAGLVEPGERFVLVDDKMAELDAVREKFPQAEAISTEDIDKEMRLEEQEGPSLREG